jgi:hypothetical protein
MCEAITNEGVKCMNGAKPGHTDTLKMCGIHWKAFEKSGSDVQDTRRRWRLRAEYDERRREVEARRQERYEMERARLVAAEGRRDAQVRRLEFEHPFRVGTEAFDREYALMVARDLVPEAFNYRLDAIRDVIARPEPPRRKKAGELGKFSADRQNVHTTAAVNNTNTILDKILKIEVPADYKWNMNTVSKTPGEVISECRLTIGAANTMMSKYTSSANVYNLGSGAYGRVLDCVWQYVRNSKDKADLCSIFKVELEDNIGMCEQGNLSRLANVLSGYLDGAGSIGGHAEELGREFPKLWEIDDEDERVEEGNKILDRLKIADEGVRKEWIDTLY